MTKHRKVKLILVTLLVIILIFVYVKSVKRVKSLSRYSETTENIEKQDLEKQEQGSDKIIPPIIHQVWIGFNGNTIPKVYKKWAQECQDLHPLWEYHLWKDEQNRKFLEEHYPWFLKTFDSYDKPIKRIDAIRYFILYHYGGVYMDGDFICLKHLGSILKPGKAIFCYQKNLLSNDSVCNAFMATYPKHPLFYNIIHALKKNSHKYVISATGPTLLTDQIRKYKGDDVMIYPMKAIYPIDWDTKAPRACVENTNVCKSLYPNSYTITVWDGSWK